MSHDELRATAERWMAEDFDAETRDELARLLAAGDQAELRDRFAGSLEFGTAGLRGVLGAGPNRMNRAVATRATVGFARHLLERTPDCRTRGVVVGFDGRRLSREMAHDAAGVLAAAGISVHLAKDVVPTPLVAFAVKELRAAGGVMITASHNPPEYNGYKVYWGNGAQIVPPHDVEIAAAIDRAPGARHVARLALEEARRGGWLVDLGEDMERRYLDALRGLSVRSDGDRTLPIVYTPLHGVGGKLVHAALAEAGFHRVHAVDEQLEPDARFPTVAFPNPEEEGALDLALALARQAAAELVLANDPDADRLGVAVRAPDGEYVRLTGNQIGVLLGHYVLTESSSPPADRLVLASIVSSPLLGVIARSLGVRYEETLTGFKWIATRAMDLEESTGTRFVFGYEEALGYTVGTVCRDKDGIGAAMLFAELAAVCRERGQSILDRLEAIYRRHGLHMSLQRSIALQGAEGLARLRAAMARLRERRPEAVGGERVVAFSDYLAKRRFEPPGAATGSALTLPASDMVALETSGGTRLMARPSGTEPKLKIYVDLCEPVGGGEPLAAAQARASRRLAAMERAMREVMEV